MLEHQFYISGSETQGYAVIDARAGMPLCATKSTMTEALEVVIQWKLPLSPLMWCSDSLAWVNIKPDDNE
jgi:hypothetical protein